MKVLCTVFILSALFAYTQALSDNAKEMMAMLHKTCVDETGVDEAVIEEARNKNLKPDDKLKCYLRCLLAQVSIMDDDGMIDIESLIGMLAEEVPEDVRPKMTQVMTSCGTKIGADPCDNAYLTNKCWLEGAPELYTVI